MRRFILIWHCLLAIVFLECKEPYNPTIISSSESYLVVEGILNAGQGPTSIKLSRTFKLDDTARLRGETNASVIVEGKDNTVRALNMTTDGIYMSPDLGLVLGQEYRLKINTADGKIYESDYVVARTTPAVDSLEFKQTDKGVQIYANTHDPANNTWYYLWNFDETWEIKTYYYSKYKYENNIVTERTLAEDVSTCWKYDISKNIIIGSSASLQSDVIAKVPINFIVAGDEKLAVRYSLLLRQFALDKQGYQFYELMKKNTESLGSIFDAQPSEIRGNIRCTSNPGEPVIGYVTSSTVAEKRYFIARRDLNSWRFEQDCPSDTVPNHPDSIKLAYQTYQGIYDAVFSMTSPAIVGYTTSYFPCIDCTERQGSLIRPSYW